MVRTILSINDIQRLRLDLARSRAGGKHSLYRGQSNECWEINTSLNRVPTRKTWNELWTAFKSAFEGLAIELKRLGYLNYKPKTENTNFYLLSAARHLGFACNLIDWTSSLDMALFATCEKNMDKDGALFVLYGNLNINERPINIDPLTIDKSILVCKDFDFMPNNQGLSNLPLARMRRLRQHGFFSVISKKDIESDYKQLLPSDISIHKIIIPSALKAEINDYIQQIGISKEWFFLNEVLPNQSIKKISEINSKIFM